MSSSAGLAPGVRRREGSGERLSARRASARCSAGHTEAVGTEDVNERFRRYRRTQDRRLRNDLIEEHRWIAAHCARRFHHRGVDLDDLIQVGQLGVLKAIERFDPDRGVSIATYAIPTVIGELRQYFRDATWALKVPALPSGSLTSA